MTCIRLPSPPNHIVPVLRPAGVALEDIHAPHWLSGFLNVEPVNHRPADAANALSASKVALVDESER